MSRTNLTIVLQSYKRNKKVSRLLWMCRQLPRSLALALIDEYNWLDGIPELQNPFQQLARTQTRTEPILAELLCITFNWSLSRYGYDFWEKALDSLPERDKQPDSTERDRERRAKIAAQDDSD